MYTVLVRRPDGRVGVVPPAAGAGAEAAVAPVARIPAGAPAEVPAEAVPAVVRAGEPTRWTWDDTNRWYPELLAAGTRVERCHDLRLSRVILRHSPLSAATALARAPRDAWDDLPAAPAPGPAADPATGDSSGTLFALAEAAPAAPQPALDPAAELSRQHDAVASATDPGRLRLLLAAESAGALAAAEMNHAGLPWRADVHDQILTAALGSRPPAGRRPDRLKELAAVVRTALDAPDLNPDSLPALLRALNYAGLAVRTTSKWELAEIDHPVVEPLLEYKSLARLLTANGWTWLDTWVHNGRFRTDYNVGGVVTGRWSTSGGGALQLPRALRRAVIADPGWTLVVADAAQLEPRVLAGLAGDDRMVAAARGGDIYQGMVDAGAVATRDQAKVGMLGAMYGGTTGVSAAVLPRLAVAFPTAIAYVERAARVGERGEVVATHLGRGSPPPGEAWRRTQGSAFDEDADAATEARARSQTRAWGRFTRNFVVQGTAAEWALCWLASIRRQLWELGEEGAPGAAPAPFSRRPHLAYFLHDEVIVHAPAALGDAVAQVLRDAAQEAGRLLFGAFPITFPVTVAIVECYSDAK